MVSPYLTEVQQKEWQTEGFLLIKNVLSPAEIDTLLTAVDSAIETYVQETPSLQGNNPFGKGSLYDYPRRLNGPMRWIRSPIIRVSSGLFFQ